MDIDVSAKNVEEAIEQGLAKLGKTRAEVEITVLSEGRAGILGIGAEDARVRLTVKSSVASPPVTTPAATVPASAMLNATSLPAPTMPAPTAAAGPLFTPPITAPTASNPTLAAVPPATIPPVAAMPGNQAALEGEEESEVGTGEDEKDTPERRQEIATLASEVLNTILEGMDIKSEIQIRSTNPITLNINGGDNLGLLIGRRGETLSSLQLILNLIVSHQTKHRQRIQVDVENYKLRREDQLRSLATRMAQQVRTYKKAITMEAMPPHERRIIHITLQDNADISTDSVGEGDERRVVISLKRPMRR